MVALCETFEEEPFGSAGGGTLISYYLRYCSAGNSGAFDISVVSGIYGYRGKGEESGLRRASSDKY